MSGLEESPHVGISVIGFFADVIMCLLSSDEVLSRAMLHYNTIFVY